MFNWDSIKIDTKKRALSIRKRSPLNNNNPMDFSLDGWTGRYGIPLEFLLSIHEATLMPDLAFDVATSFPTNVNVYLHEGQGDVVTAYKTDDDHYITSDQIRSSLSEVTGLDDFSTADPDSLWGLTGFLQGLSQEEIEALDGLGLPLVYGEGTTYYVPGTGHIALNNDGQYIEMNDYFPYESLVSEEDIDDLSGYVEVQPGRYLSQEDLDNYINDYNPMIIDDEANLDISYDVTNERDILTILNRLTAYDDDYETYFPYIASVTDHWYRDVYFVLEDENLKFVKNDYEYEKAMRERWTLYERKSDGSEQLYRVNDDGSFGEKYNGTIEEANKEGIKVSKKAKLLDNTELADLKWNNDNGIWIAYSPETKGGGGSTEFDPLYGDSEDKIEQRIYSKVNITSGMVKQEGEGLRTETNAKIKKMFTTNKYFRYTGDRKTAEIITTLRNNALGGAYGPVVDKDAGIDNSDKTVDIEGKTYKVDDYISNVSLNQDSLSAFSMLENTHTLDSDYIYRDFKELIVELGYFEKEELTNEMPRLLEFLVPSIGSYGYPFRNLDKNENEYGTMLHSKGDIDVIRLEVLKEAISKVVSNQNGGNTSDNSPSSSSSPSSSGNMVSLGSSGSSGDLLSLEDWWAEIDAMMAVFTQEHWTYEMVHDYGSFEEARAAGARHTDCSLFASWALQKLGALEEGQTFSSHIADGGDLNGEDPAVAQSLLDAGAEVIVVNGSIGSEDKLEPGDVVFFNDKVGHVTIYFGEGPLCYDAGSAYWNSQTEPINYNSVLTRNCTIILRFPFGKSKDPGEEYKGYVGNEAVVSPVTGILLEYGTYNGEKDSITNEPYRTNVDLKYHVGEQDADRENDNTERDIPHDNVGYAKIFVLDKSTYMQMGGTGVGIDGDGGFIDMFKNMSAEDIEDAVDEMDDRTKTLYGYKEFLENYEYAGISGHIVYIDGFLPEYPIEIEEEHKDGNFIPSEEGEVKQITMDVLRGLNGVEPDETNSEYEPDEEHKLASEIQTEKLKAEISIKEAASPVVDTGGMVKLQLIPGKDEVECKGLFLKEGTIIGRTMTDKELLEGGIRQGATMTYDEARPEVTAANVNDEDEEQDYGKIIGNYLRIIMLENTSRDEVEDVEDYMKLDDGIDDDKKTLGSIEQFMYWQAKEPEGFEYIIDGQQSYSLIASGGSSRRDNASDKYGHDYGVDDGGAGDANLCPGMWMDEGSSGKPIFEKVTGKTPIKGETFCTGTQLLDIYTQELQVNMDEIRKEYPITETLDDEDTRLFALIDVMYAGGDNFKIGTIDDKLLAGDLNLTKEDFLSNCTDENPFYSQNANGFTRRRLHDFYMYSEGYFCHDIYDTQGTEITQRWDFISDTPFQDLMVDKEGAELVNM